MPTLKHLLQLLWPRCLHADRSRPMNGARICLACGHQRPFKAFDAPRPLVTPPVREIVSGSRAKVTSLTNRAKRR
jgi:hypothetical protein